jgi:hypothetical protein
VLKRRLRVGIDGLRPGFTKREFAYLRKSKGTPISRLPVRHAAALTLIAATLIGSASLPEYANAQSNPYALDRLFLDSQDSTPLNEVLSFDSATEVDDYFGVSSEQARLAKEFYANGGAGVANMLFARYPYSPARAHLYGANISNSLTVAQLQTIHGPLTLTSQGYNLSGSVNLSGVTSFSQAASRIANAFNKNLPVEAATTGSSIAPESVDFTGSINANIVTVNAVSPGSSIQIGSLVNGFGVPPGMQIAAQLSGTPNGVGTYAVFLHGLTHISPPVPTESLTDTYGVLTIGATSSGTVAVGQQVTGAGILPQTAIEAAFQGSGAGNTWVVNQAQTVASGNMAMTPAPIGVVYNVVQGANDTKTGAFRLQQQGFVNFSSSSLSYVGGTGTAATLLGLTQASGAYDSTPGQIVTSASAFMDNLTQNESGGNEFDSFQTTYSVPGGPRSQEEEALEAWAQSENGQYDFLANYTNSTPPIEGSTSSAQLAFATTGATAPEPSTWAMALLGFASLGLARYRYRLRLWTCLRIRQIGSMGRRPQDLGLLQ